MIEIWLNHDRTDAHKMPCGISVSSSFPAMVKQVRWLRFLTWLRKTSCRLSWLYLGLDPVRWDDIHSVTLPRSSSCKTEIIVFVKPIAIIIFNIFNKKDLEDRNILLKATHCIVPDTLSHVWTSWLEPQGTTRLSVPMRLSAWVQSSSSVLWGHSLLARGSLLMFHLKTGH